eukprot:10394681-Ditylum_brightwellii.AAC.1
MENHMDGKKSNTPILHGNREGKDVFAAESNKEKKERKKPLESNNDCIRVQYTWNAKKSTASLEKTKNTSSMGKKIKTHQFNIQEKEKAAQMCH